MTDFSFDEVIDRRGTNCNKWDGRFGGGPVAPDCLPFTIADMDFAAPPCVAEALSARVGHPVYGYTHAGPDLNAAVTGWMQRRHGVTVEKDWLKSSTGILTGLALALRTVTRPGDRVMVFTPVYNPFFHVVEGAGCVLAECRLRREDDRYTIDFAAVEAMLRDGVKAILFCNPHNPVGRVWTGEELARLAELCIRYGVYLLSDEAHADFGLFGNAYTPLCALPEMRELGISCISPNKSFNIPGVGMAFLIIPNSGILASTAAAHRGLWITSPPLLSMAAAEAGYSRADEWMDAVGGYIEENSRFVREFAAEQMPELRFARHEGTYLLWMDVSCFGIPADAAAEELTETCGVQLSAGSAYRGDGGSHLRFNIAAPRRLLARALEAMLPMYRKYCAEH